MNPEREKEIRAFQCVGEHANIIPDLLAEIDRLRNAHKILLGISAQYAEERDKKRACLHKAISLLAEARSALSDGDNSSHLYEEINEFLVAAVPNT